MAASTPITISVLVIGKVLGLHQSSCGPRYRLSTVFCPW